MIDDSATGSAERRKAKWAMFFQRRRDMRSMNAVSSVSGAKAAVRCYATSWA
jgi:hypothetical protein